jgi:hypothetical protein
MAVKHYDWKVGEPPPELGPHSVAKHKILRAYILKYLEIGRDGRRHRSAARSSFLA